MDGDQNQPTSPPDLRSVFQGTPDKKKVLLIAGLVVFVLILGAVVLLLSGGSQNNTGENRRGEPSQNGGTRTGGNIPTTPQISAPQKVAQSFYDWYVLRPETLSRGEFKTRADITDEYKAIMETYVTRGLPADRDPVFNCGDYPLTQKVRALSPEYDELQQQALVTLQEAGSTQDLYIIKVAKVEGQWKIRDVWCAS